MLLATMTGDGTLFAALRVYFARFSLRQDRALFDSEPSGHLRKCYVSGRCARADKVQHLAGSHSKIFGPVGWQTCRCAVRRDNRSAAKREPNRQRCFEPDLIGLRGNGVVNCVAFV
jgi:hypothetical protein